MNDPESLRTDGIARDQPLGIFVNGKRIEAFPGETVQAALFAAGFRVLRESKTGGGGRGPFCGMGVCYECLVTIDGKPGRRACMAPVREGMEITIHER
jgi:D-hydroxyproline dehydrogenase subunit gamma